jgi:cyclic pyranopterin phosphate synthase
VQVAKDGIAKGITKIRLTGGEPLVRKGIVDLVAQLAKLDGLRDLSMTTNGILLSQFADDLATAGLNRVNISLDTTSAKRYAEITRGGDIDQVYSGIAAAKKAGLHPIKINCVVFKNRHEQDAQDVAKFCEENDLQIRYIHQMDLQTGEFSIVEGGEGGDCANCNRLRLTANGELRPCLFNDLSFNIKEQGVEQAYQNALDKKPKAGTKSKSGKFYGIGG